MLREQDEGYLTKMRSKIVERRNLNQLGKDMGLLDFFAHQAHPKAIG